MFLFQLATDAGEFKESDHPRKDNGQFGQGAAGHISPMPRPIIFTGRSRRTGSKNIKIRSRPIRTRRARKSSFSLILKVRPIPRDGKAISRGSRSRRAPASRRSVNSFVSPSRRPKRRPQKRPSRLPRRLPLRLLRALLHRRNRVLHLSRRCRRLRANTAPCPMFLTL